MISIRIDLDDYGKKQTRESTSKMLKDKKFIQAVSKEVSKKKSRQPGVELKAMAKMLRDMTGPQDKTGVPFFNDTTAPYVG